jgi:hypothetical protein
MAQRVHVDPDLLHLRAQVAVLAGLTRGDDVFDLQSAVAPYEVPDHFTPDVAMLDLAVTALELACPHGAERLEYEGLRERYLPEVTFRDRIDHRSSQYAIYAAASMRGGLQPDLLNDAGWWQRRRLWTYAVFTVVIYARAAAERLGVPVEDIVQRIAARHDLELGSADDPGGR